MATISNIDLGASATLTANTVDTIEILAGRASRVVVVTNLHATGIMAISHGLKGTAAAPTVNGDFNYLGPYQSMPIETGGAALDVKLISATACPYLLNVQTYLT
ncbi:MAG TPA: hypothetical protein VF228_17320 [Iamia sp.]